MIHRPPSVLIAVRTDILTGSVSKDVPMKLLTFNFAADARFLMIATPREYVSVHYGEETCRRGSFTWSLFTEIPLTKVNVDGKWEFDICWPEHKCSSPEFLRNRDAFFSRRLPLKLPNSLPCPDRTHTMSRPVYVEMNSLGNGGYAEVFQVKDASNGEEFACKKYIRNDRVSVEKFEKAYNKEMYLLKRYGHQVSSATLCRDNAYVKKKQNHIVKFHDETRENGIPRLIMEYLPEKTLLDVRDTSPFTLTEICEILKQIASSLRYLHINGLAHRLVSSRASACRSQSQAASHTDNRCSGI